ncbi:MAG: aminotransferase DegT [Legionellales bacterium RIFCSPHIGHO2_12_FULL_37_14]|nr:MAG: aminotransferase DegT [Legionellales bacterium RIFCSPHIGHO2_12_FULL_37_14]
MQFIDLKKQYSLMEEGILARIKAVLDHGQYIMGPEITELENKLANFVKVKHVIVNSSGTDALFMALLALDIKPGDEIITSPFSFFATAEVILLLNAKPVFVDIDPNTYNINPNLIEKAITEHTKAIMPVSLYGHCADFTSINAIAKAYNLPVVEDAAQSFGGMQDGKYSCALSTIGCASFFPSKPLGAYGDAGACFTDDDNLAEILREIRNHGQQQRYEHIRLGLNARMDTIQAAILLEKFAHFSQEMQMRQQVATNYNRLLNSMVKTPTVLPNNLSAYAQYTIEVDDRDIFFQMMNAKGIPTAVHYPIVMHQQVALKDLGYKDGDFPIAERASKRVVSLPMHPYLTEADQLAITNALREIVCLSACA